MNIGKLRLRVQIQRYTEKQDDTHRTYKNWETIHTVWASMEPVKGLVMLDTKNIGEGVTVKVTIRYQPYITTEHWLYMNSRRFRIRAVRNLIEQNKFIELLCEEDSLAIDEFRTDVNRVEDPLNVLG
jgi:SPP1 family predicted phage head-tail adaptor